MVKYFFDSDNKANIRIRYYDETDAVDDVDGEEGNVNFGESNMLALSTSERRYGSDL